MPQPPPARYRSGARGTPGDPARRRTIAEPGPSRLPPHRAEPSPAVPRAPPYLRARAPPPAHGRAEPSRAGTKPRPPPTAAGMMSSPRPDQWRGATSRTSPTPSIQTRVGRGGGNPWPGRGPARGGSRGGGDPGGCPERGPGLLHAGGSGVRGPASLGGGPRGQSRGLAAPRAAQPGAWGVCVCDRL